MGTGGLDLKPLLALELRTKREHLRRENAKTRAIGRGACRSRKERILLHLKVTSYIDMIGPGLVAEEKGALRRSTYGDIASYST